MTTTATKLLTAEEFFDWVHRPENRDRHFELVNGEVVEMTKPGDRHGFVCANLAFILTLYTRQRRRGYVCANDTGVILARGPDTVRGPDVIFREEARRYDDLEAKYYDRPPTLIAEVISPTDRWGRVLRRLSEFLHRGVKMAWLVDPEDRSVTVLRLDQIPQVFDEGDDVVAEDVLPGFRCRVAELFVLPGEEGGATPETAPPAAEPPKA